MLWEFLALKCSVFQNFDFFRSSIDRICLSIDRKCDKNLGLNLLGSIAARLILDQSNMFFDRSKLIFDWLKFESWFLLKKKIKKKGFFACVHHFFKTFPHFLSSFDQIYIYIYFYFLFSALIFQGFLSSCPSKSLLTLLFQLIHIFHAFFMWF